jgi:hypothetical protein
MLSYLKVLSRPLPEEMKNHINILLVDYFLSLRYKYSPQHSVLKRSVM